VKKIAVAVLSLSLLGALPSAQAAAVSVDAGTFTFTYDDSFLAGSSFSSAGGVFTFSGLNYLAAALGNVVPLSSSGGTFDGYFGKPAPILITPKAGYQIIGLTESVSGYYVAASGPDQSSFAGAAGSVGSYWVYQNGVTPLDSKPASQGGFASAQGPTQIGGAYTASVSQNFLPTIASEHLAPGAIMLSATELRATAVAYGTGSGAVASLNQYQIGVQTAAVPEPEVLALVLAGLGVVGLRLGRRNQA
jgi:hypothetical protein